MTYKPPRNSCITYPNDQIVTLDGSDKWVDHHVVYIRNKCTGKCLVLDDGFWGTLGSVYDPCTVSPPLLGPTGMAEWNNIRTSCGCGGTSP